MGLVRLGPPTDLILRLKERWALDVFIESGTFQGATAIWASAHFAKIFTIEYSKSLYEDIVARNGTVSNIDFIFGDSRDALKTLAPQIKTPAIFWLDGHWCGMESYGETDQCPLIRELHEIHQSPLTHYLLIDDARLFLSPPPLPNQMEYWPSIDVVVQVLQSSGKQYYIAICEDVIIAVPLEAKEIVATYCQQINSKAWQQYVEQNKQAQRSVLVRGMEQMLSGTRLVLSGIRHELRRILP